MQTTHHFQGHGMQNQHTHGNRSYNERQKARDAKREAYRAHMRQVREQMSHMVYHEDD